MEKKVLLGMSGGVDSSVAALLLKQNGYEVYGTTMLLCGNSDIEKDAKKVCDNIGITHYTFDFRKEFQESVIDNFALGYSKNITPNPCIECNKYLKFGAMYKKAQELGIEYIATGHYAITSYSEKYGEYVLKKSKNISKDQSYVLYSIPKDLLGKIIFPLGEFESKEKIREIAKQNDLETAEKPDSEDICFIPDGNYKKFLEENYSIEARIGDIVDKKGNILGKHYGLYNYTIGQRKGIKISSQNPLYVLGFNKEKNQLIVGAKEELYRKEMLVENINLLLIDDLKDPLKVNIKTRYSTKEQSGVIEKISQDKIKVVFDEQAPRITPGQSAVFYIDDIVVGGGVIVE